MSSQMMHDRALPFLSSVVLFEGVRGKFSGYGAVMYSEQAFPDDPAGTFLLTLQNVVIGSRWEIETVSAPGVLVQSGIAASATVLVTLNSYTTSHALNSLAVKVRKASESPYYQPFETQTTAFSGAYSIYVNQVRDDA